MLIYRLRRLACTGRKDARALLNTQETMLTIFVIYRPYQQLTHHAASGCGMGAGDLIGTGTISGSETNQHGTKRELGCLFDKTPYSQST